eukprot:TRINITY_DN61465_c0_g1_i1.p1 TRINITY_DN61465_c0_g1~~TRINITY_DN61465_c0_g1_i1.p1  ORF type:complete len:677 (-),score=82.12 TRINITY_DN61465_c0_g1_i1:179-2209(-)
MTFLREFMSAIDLSSSDEDSESVADTRVAHQRTPLWPAKRLRVSEQAAQPSLGSDCGGGHSPRHNAVNVTQVGHCGTGVESAIPPACVGIARANGSNNALPATASVEQVADAARHASDASAPLAARVAQASPIFLNRLLDGIGPGGSNQMEEVSLQDIFERHPLNGVSPVEVLLANFMVDLAWLIEECPSLRDVPRLTVMHGDGGQGCVDTAMLPRVRSGLETRVHAPPLPLDWGTHHSKLAILFYPDAIRVCVRTFNDIFCDFHHKSQAMYLQDFPCRSRPSQSPPAAVEGLCSDEFGKDFALQLQRYLDRCGGFDTACLSRYDFSTAAAALVASVPGYHRGRDLSDWGHMRLRELLSRHALQPATAIADAFDELEEEAIVCQFSSVGSLSKRWVDDFHLTLSTTRTPLSVPTPPACASKGRRPEKPRLSDAARRLPPLRLVMPTVSQVRDSFEGWVAGVSLFAKQAQLRGDFAPLWRRWGPADMRDTSRAAERARDAMPHVKSYVRYVMPRSGDDCGTPALLWIVVGSHNFSKAAWGELQKGGTQLCIRSYELGVALFPNRLDALEPDPEQQGYFLRHRQTLNKACTCPVFVPHASAPCHDRFATSACTWKGLRALRVVCPTQVPPAGPPDDGDCMWARDMEFPESAGLDRFGTHIGERQARFYGFKSAGRCAA